MDSSKETCAICLGRMTAGQGQALFTAECSHTFHFNCITSNVQHGNHICPTCRSTWKNLPFVAPPPPPPSPFTFPSFYPIVQQQQPISSYNDSFDDDESLPSIPTAPTTGCESLASPSQAGCITVHALPEYPALGQSQSDSFAVLVGIRAPPLSPQASDRPDTRAPLDLVAVLDVSGSMQGDKIRLLKEAVKFIVDNLGPTDRLSIVTFSTFSRRVTPLTRMTDAGRTETARAVNSIHADGATNIIAALQMAVNVLEQRRQRNPVSSIILLSDGQDNQNGHGSGFIQAIHRLPACIRTQNLTQTESIPVHTFGFGSDHDATALHAIADGSGGTFSYIESIEIIQDAFAQCIGGLLSVVAQEVEINVHSGSPGVRIQSIPSGRYQNVVDTVGGRHGVIYVRDLYADEEKQFLVYLSIPEDTEALTTTLLVVKCLYKDPLSDKHLASETKTVEIRRSISESLSEADRQICLEVDRERNRVSVSQGIAEAQEMAERGELENAHSILSKQISFLQSTASAQSGDLVSQMLDSEVKDVRERMSSKAKYESGGRAFALSKKSSHMTQRATTQAVQMQHQSDYSNVSMSNSFSGRASHASPQSTNYQTPLMRMMVTKSQLLRNPQNQDQGTGSSTSFGKPSS